MVITAIQLYESGFGFFSKSLKFSGPQIHLHMKSCLHILHVLSYTEFYESMVNTFKLLVCVLFEKKKSRYDTASLILTKLFHYIFS